MEAYPSTPSCNLAWIDTVVNSIATNAPTTLPPKSTNPNDPPVDVTKFSQCCTAPGQCRVFGKEEDVDSCTSFGALNCQLGNSRYICTFIQFSKDGPTPTPSSTPPSLPSLPGRNTTDPPLLPDDGVVPDPVGPEATTCLQEGTLAITRNLPCCPPNVSKFIKSDQRTCIAKDGSDHLRDFCCQAGESGVCATSENADLDFACGGGETPDYMYEALNYGNKYAIFEGYVFGAAPAPGEGGEGAAPLELACVEEVEFGMVVNLTSACAKVEKSSCNLGGSAAGKPPTAPGPWMDGGSGSDSGTNTGGSGGNGGGSTSSARSRGSVWKKAALLGTVAPLLVQMLFL